MSINYSYRCFVLLPVDILLVEQKVFKTSWNIAHHKYTMHYVSLTCQTDVAGSNNQIFFEHWRLLQGDFKIIIWQLLELFSTNRYCSCIEFMNVSIWLNWTEQHVILRSSIHSPGSTFFNFITSSYWCLENINMSLYRTRHTWLQQADIWSTKLEDWNGFIIFINN